MTNLALFYEKTVKQSLKSQSKIIGESGKEDALGLLQQLGLIPRL